MWSFCTHFYSLILSIFLGFSWFLRYFVNECLWNMQSLQSIWDVENHVFCNFWHIYTRKIMKMLTKIMTFYHDLQIIFDRLHTFIIVEPLERFSLKRVVLFSKKSVFFHKNTPNIVTVSWIFFDIFLLFCVKNTKNMDFTKFEKGRCAT